MNCHCTKNNCILWWPKLAEIKNKQINKYQINKQKRKNNSFWFNLYSFSYFHTVTLRFIYLLIPQLGALSGQGHWNCPKLPLVMVPLDCCSESPCTCMLYEMPSLSDSSSDRLFVPRTFRRVVCANSRVAWSALETLATEQIGSKTRKYTTPSTLTVTESFVRNCSHINI